jgi:hypothetical protein
MHPIARIRRSRDAGAWYPIGVAVVLALSAGLLTAAWAGGRASSTPVYEASFLAENHAAMNRMMKAMAIKPSGDVDKDFVAMMVPHHQGAIDMAMAVLRNGHNERIRRLAQEIIITQQQEIVAMRLAVGDRVSATAAPPATPVAQMPEATQGAGRRGMERHDTP